MTPERTITTSSSTSSTAHVIRISTLSNYKYHALCGIIPEFLQGIAKSLTETSSGDALISVLRVNSRVRFLHSLCEQEKFQAILKPIQVKLKSDKVGITSAFIRLTFEEFIQAQQEVRDKVYNLNNDFLLIPYRPPIKHLAYLYQMDNRNGHFEVTNISINTDCIVITAKTLREIKHKSEVGITINLETEICCIRLPKPKDINDSELRKFAKDKKKFLSNGYREIIKIDREYSSKFADVCYGSNLDKPIFVLAGRVNGKSLSIIADIDPHTIAFDSEYTKKKEQETVRHITKNPADLDQLREKFRLLRATANTHRKDQMPQPEQADRLITKNMGILTLSELEMILTINRNTRVPIFNHGMTREYDYTNKNIPYGQFPNLSDNTMVTIVFPKGLDLIITFGSRYIKAFYDIMEEEQLYTFRQHPSWCYPDGADIEAIKEELREELEEVNLFNKIRNFKRKPEIDERKEVFERLKKSTPKGARLFAQAEEGESVASVKSVASTQSSPSESSEVEQTSSEATSITDTSTSSPETDAGSSEVGNSADSNPELPSSDTESDEHSHNRCGSCRCVMC